MYFCNLHDFCRVCMNLHDNNRASLKDIVVVMTPSILLVQRLQYFLLNISSDYLRDYNCVF